MRNTLSTSLRCLLLSGIILFLSMGARANHIAGIDLTYSWVSGNTYNVQLVVYGDCSNSTFPFLSSSVPTICVYNGGTSVGSFTLAVQAPTSGLFTAPVCVRDTDSTTCTNLAYTIPGIKKFVYSANYTLTGPSHAWRFLFNGDMGNSLLGASSAGRQSTITNILTPGTSIIQLVDTLDNTYHNNSSPALNTLPTPYYCLNNADNYNPNGVDPDGDSLSYFLVNGQNGGGFGAGCGFTAYGPVTYTGTAWTGQPVTDTTPITCTTGTFSFSHSSGQLSFTPNAAQRSLVVYNIEEYRNDTFIGTSQREMVVLVQTCSTNPPTGGMSGATGAGAIQDSVHYRVCQGTGAFSFHINPISPDPTLRIKVSYTGIPAGATFTVVGDSTTSPTTTFSWTSTGVAPGTYTFYVTFKDDNCPINGSNTIPFTVSIIAFPIISGTLTVCQGATSTLTGAPTGGTWTSATTAVATIGSGTGIVSGITLGTSVISYSLGVGCATGATVTVVASPAAISGSPVVCVGFTRTLTDATPGGTWTSSTPAVATIGSSTGVMTGVTVGTTTISYLVAGCYATVVATVIATPPSISGTTPICSGTTATFTDTSPGGTWTSSNTAVATVGSSTGVVTGVSGGTANITYTSAGGCYVFMPVTINPSPVAIVGPSTVCVGHTITLTDATPGGIWSSTNPLIASITPGGVVTGLSVGTTVISYTSAGCAATLTVTVYAVPSPISGGSTICVGDSNPLFDVGGGSWTSSNVAIATVGLGTGIVTGISAGTVTITYTLSTGCYTTFPMTVNALPSPILGSPNLCVGSTTTLTDATVGGFWSSFDPTIASIADPTVGVVTGVSIGTTTISYTAGSGCSATITVTVNAPPTPISGTLSVCVGSTTPLFDCCGGTWSSSDITKATVGSISGIVTGVATGNPIISYTASTGCSATAILTVNPLPGPISGLSVICVGLTTSLTDPTPGGTWTSTSPGVATVFPSTGLVTGITPGFATITYTIIGTGCAATHPMTINSTPGTIVGPTNMCVGTTTTYTDGGGGTWNSSNTAVATIGSLTGFVTAVSPGNTTITYSLGVGCTTTVVLTVNPLPSPIVGAATVCVGLTTTLTDPTLGGTWTSSNPLIATVGTSSGIVTGVGPGPVTITYSLATGCTRTKAMTVNPSPASFIVTGGGSYCVGGTGVHIGLSGSAIGVNYQLYDGVSLVGAPVPGTGLALDFGLFTVAGTYTIVATIPATGCTRNMTGSVVISINPLPTPFTVTGGGNYCAGGTGLHIGLSGSTAGVNYQLFNGVVAVGAPLAGTGSALDFGLQTLAGTYTVVATNAVTGCTNNMTGSATITVNPIPTITGPTAVCPTATITLTGTPAGGTWVSSTPAVATVGAGTGIVTGVTTGTTLISYTSLAGCLNTITVTVSPGPSSIVGPPTACVGSTVTLTDPVPGGTWTSSAPAIATVGSLTGIVTGVAIGTTTITYSLGLGCIATKVMTVTAAPAPITGPASVCVGSTITLSDATAGGNWSSSAPPTATVGSSTGVVTGIAAGTVTISYAVGAGCPALRTITVNPTPGPIGGSSNVCASSTITLTDPVPGGSWTSSAPAIASIGSGTGIVNGIAPGTAIITYAIGTCTTIKTITVNATAPITGTLGICVGTTSTLSDAIPGGSWSSGSPAIATVGITGIVTGVSPGTSVITYTLLSGCSVTTTVTVNTAPTIIGGALNVCVGSTSTLTDGAPGGTWTSASPGIATIGSSSGIVTGIAPGTSLITYSIGSGCFVNTTVTVIPLPAPITGSGNVCIGSSITLSDVTTGGTWSSTNLAVATVGSTGIVNGLSVGTTTISYTIGSGCASVKSITVNPIPGPVTGLTSVCVGLTTTLGDATPGGTWTSSNPATATIGSVSGLVTGVAPGTVTITYSIASCTATTTVTVIPSPGPITGVTNVCIGTTTTLGNIVGGGTWTSSNPAAATIGSSSGIVSGIASGTVIITYSVGTCYRIAPVVVNPLSPIQGTPIVCAGQTTVLSDTSLGGTWTSSTTAIATVTPLTGIVTGVSGGTATISYTLPTGCLATIVVTVNPIPAPISGSPVICVGQTTALTDATPGGTWTSSSIAVGTISPAGIVSGLAAGTTTISYTLGTTCAVALTITVNGNPAPIGGPTVVCLGGTITLTDGVGGGIWTSSNPAVATIGSSSGVVSGLTLGTVTIAYTLGTGCNVTSIVNVDSALPPITGPMSLCVGTTTTLADGTPGGTWSSASPTVASVGAGTGVVTGNSPGPAVITYSIGTGCTAHATVTVNLIPVGITGTPNVCVGQTTTLSDFTPGGSWSSSDPTIATIGSSSGIVTGVTPGSVTISYSLGTGCNTTMTMVVNPGPLPITGVPLICLGATTTLSDATPLGTWTSSNPAIAPVSPTGVVSGLALGTATISYTAGCTATQVVTVNPLPTAIAGNPNVCIGSTTALSDGVTGGVWSSSDITIATVGSSSGIVTGVSFGTVTIVYSLGAGCTTSITVTVNALPAPITGPTEVCATQTITLSDATFGGVWSSGTIATATIDSTTGILTGVSGGVATISYTLGCSTTYLVTVNPMPSAISGSGNVCLGGTSALHDAVLGGTWTSSDISVATVGSSSGIVTGVNLGTATITYALGSCYVVKTINVYPLPLVFNVSGGGSYCAGGTGEHVYLSGSTVGVNYLLYRGVTATGTFAGTGAPLDFGLQTVAGTYTVVGTSTATSCSINMADSAVITIMPSVIPAVSININPADSVCAGTSVTFTPIPANGGVTPTYLWDVNGFPVAFSTTYTFIPANGDIVTVTMTSSANCALPPTATGSVTMNVMPYAAPTVSIAVAPNDTVCKGTVVTLTAVPAYGGTAPLYTWMKNGDVAGGSGTFAWIPDNGDFVYAIMQSNYPCRTANRDTSSQVVITVDTPIAPIVAINAVPGTMVQVGQTVTLTAVVTGGTTNLTYQWLKNGIPIPSATNATYTSSSYNYPKPDSVTCMVTTNDICTVTGFQWTYINVSNVGVQTLTHAGDISVLPNPNKGEFMIKGSLETANDEDVSLEITDMLGQVVYKDNIVAKGGKLNEKIVLRSTLANGMYMLTLRSATENKVFHMVIEQ